MQHWKTEASIARDSPGPIVVIHEAQNLQEGIIEGVRRHGASEVIILQDKDLKHGQGSNTNRYGSP